MKRSELIPLFTILSPFVFVLLILWWFPNYADTLISISKQYPVIAPLVVILWRIIAIVIPPLPGGVVSLALIPVFGWFFSFVYAVVGVMIGSCIAFFIARKYREPVVKRIVPLQQLQQWQGKLSKNTEFFAFAAIRIATGPIFDFMSYIAGLTSISFKKFFVVTLITLLPDAFYYYVGDTIYQTDPVAGILIIMVFIFGYYVIQKLRFLEALTGRKIIHQRDKKVHIRSSHTKSP